MKDTVDHNTLADILSEIQEQPAWRSNADKEMDYRDGNQKDAEALQDLADKGMKPTTENVLGPTMEDITGMEAKNRTDWKAEPDGESTDQEADDVAKAIGWKLNQAERRSGADRALTKAYDSLSGVGVGFVEVDRNPNLFQYPYKVNFVHRNECWWDWFSKADDLSDARWFLRRRWVHESTAKTFFPSKKRIIDQSRSGFGSIDDLTLMSQDGGESTGLAQALDVERGWSVEEMEWKDPSFNRVCLFQLLTRHFKNIHVLRLSNGRTVELDKTDPLHIAAISSGVRVEKSVTSDIKKSIFLGPHIMQQEPSEFDRFNFVAVFGKREDRTRVPYGILRWLMPLQDEINTRITKMKWLLGATRTIRTVGAVNMTDAAFRQEVGRADADIKLNDKAMSNPGARFEIDSNMELNRQQYERLLDLRESVKRISGVSDSFSGDASPDNNGAMSQAIEQSIQSLATLNDNFSYARTQVGELLMSMIVRDIGEEQQQVVIKGNALKEDTVIALNTPTTDPDTGHTYLTNDVKRTMIKVALNDVPSTPSFRQQEMMSLTEVMKSSSEDIKAILMPHYLHLTNIPDKDEIVTAVRDIAAGANVSREQMEQIVEEAKKEAVESAKTQWMVEQKNRELDIKEFKVNAEVKKIINESVNAAIESIYSATQAGVQVASTPGIAQVADQVLKSAGFEDQDAAPIVPGVTVPAQPAQQNTSPMFPPRVQEPEQVGMEEVETQQMQSPGVGMNEGIEAEGVQ